MKYYGTYGIMGDYSLHEAHLIITNKTKQHVEDRHGKNSIGDGTKFKEDIDFDNVLSDGFHLEGINDNEYRGETSDKKYGITAKRTQKELFEMLTMYPVENDYYRKNNRPKTRKSV